MVPSNPWGRYRTAFFSVVCLLESLWVIILPRRFHASPMEGPPHMHVWKQAGYKTVCFTLLLSTSWEPETTVAVKGSLLQLRVFFNSYFSQILSCPWLSQVFGFFFFFPLESCNSISEFCSLCKLERRGQMTPGFAKWYFTVGMTALLAQTLPWQRGTASCICNAYVSWLMDLLVLTRLLISETVCQKT